MPFLAIVLTTLLLGVSSSEAAAPNQKLAFWDGQRRGANGGGGSDPEEWFEAAAEIGCDRRVPGAREYLAELIAELNTHRWHWAFYSFRASDWDGLDYELGTQELGWKYWQERDKGVDHERLIERHDNPLWEVLKSEFSETRFSPPD